MKQYKCENCGAPVNPNTGVCEYCGTIYEIRCDRLLRIEEYRNPVKVYKTAMEIPNESLYRDPDAMSRLAIHHLAHNLADAIKESLEFESEYCGERAVQRITAKVRIVEPKYLF